MNQRRLFLASCLSLVVTAITKDAAWTQELLACPHIERLNLGPIPTIQLNWLQPHEGSLVDFLFRARAFGAF